MTPSALKVTKVLDSRCVSTNARITTYQIEGLWKILLQEIERHRVLSLCSGSSRAIPARKFREQVLNRPFVPVYWGKNQSGMQARAELSGWRKALARRLWLWGRLAAVALSWAFEKVGLHKQLANRVLEPWAVVDLVITATEWNNFFLLRCHPDAQPELQEVARLIERLHYDPENLPQELTVGGWHLPFITEEDLDACVGMLPKAARIRLKTISAARCARGSYHRSGEILPYEKDQELVSKLSSSQPKHLSPFEHQAMATITRLRVGNFVGWTQWRKFFPDESGGDYKNLSKMESVGERLIG